MKVKTGCKKNCKIWVQKLKRFARINKVEDVLKIGDTIEVKITEIDKQGRVNASHKVLEQSKN